MVWKGWLFTSRDVQLCAAASDGGFRLKHLQLRSSMRDMQTLARRRRMRMVLFVISIRVCQSSVLPVNQVYCLLPHCMLPRTVKAIIHAYEKTAHTYAGPEAQAHLQHENASHKTLFVKLNALVDMQLVKS